MRKNSLPRRASVAISGEQRYSSSRYACDDDTPFSICHAVCWGEVRKVDLIGTTAMFLLPCSRCCRSQFQTLLCCPQNPCCFSSLHSWLELRHPSSKRRSR